MNINSSIKILNTNNILVGITTDTHENNTYEIKHKAIQLKNLNKLQLIKLADIVRTQHNSILFTMALIHSHKFYTLFQLHLISI